MGEAPLIEIKNLSKTYNFGRFKALDGINLEIHTGEIFGLIGQNGAGKTTLMGCMLGLLNPSAGSVNIKGRSVNEMDVKRQTGFMPERPNFDKWMTVRQFLTYHHMLSGGSLRTAKENIERCLGEVELEPHAWNRRIVKLSRGMLQRVGLAQLLIGQPTLCFLDEPTSGMDPIGMTLVRELLLKWKAAGATVILNSHHLDEVEKVCDRVAFINGGKIQSIENVRAAQSAYIYTVRWDCSNGSDSPNGILEQMAEELSIIIESREDSCVRLKLADNKTAPEVIKFLVAHNVAVSEALFEKKALLDLFVSQRSE